jgi:phenylacetate-CoA ligase
MLYPFMREKIEQVFHCRVYNRYGSREVGDIACEREGVQGFWVAPWGNYVEIVDEQGRRVPDGEEGDILVTSLSNMAMPLIRYKIGDRGVLKPRADRQPGEPYGQVLASLLGRNVDVFRTSTGTMVYSGYFMTLLYVRRWVKKFQVIQKGLDRILFKIVSCDSRPPQAELDQITRETRILFGENCQVDFEFPEDIPVTGSGKYRYTICELDNQSERN